jgi:dolichol kinase
LKGERVKIFGKKLKSKFYSGRNTEQIEVRECLPSFGTEFLSYSFLSKNIKMNVNRIIIFSVVLYGFETWSFTRREEHRLRLLYNRVLRKIFGPKGDEVRGE